MASKSKNLQEITEPASISDSKDRQISFAATFVLSGLASVTAESFTYPLDVLKTRLQVTRHLTPYQVTRKLFMEEGLMVLTYGIEAAWMRHIVYSGIRVVTYEFLRDNVFKRNPDGSYPIYKSAAGAIISGGFGQFIASPTDFVKVQMQVEGLRLIKGEQRLYTSTLDCVKRLYGEYGFFGMWRGWIPNTQRAALVQIGDLCAYDTSKQLLLKHFGENGSNHLKDNYVTHGLASFAAGLVATIFCNPCDVVKTRIMNNPEQYKGVINCFVLTVRHEGFGALYKGFFPIWARCGPWSMIFFLTFEKLRNLYGISSW